MPVSDADEYELHVVANNRILIKVPVLNATDKSETYWDVNCLDFVERSLNWVRVKNQNDQARMDAHKAQKLEIQSNPLLQYAYFEYELPLVGTDKDGKPIRLDNSILSGKHTTKIKNPSCPESTRRRSKIQKLRN